MNVTNLNNPSPDKRVGYIERLLPRRLKPYAALVRLDRPIGTWLLLWPCFWSLALATNGIPDIRLCGIFALGALLMRSAGCVYNDIIDRKIDSKVQRTLSRPIASGQISVRNALLFLTALLAASCLLLILLNDLAIYLCIASLFLVFTYPLMKRITHWPQIFLGLTFNWGALVAWAAYDNSIGLPAVFLYIAGIFWTLGYDTIYALQDKAEDSIIGVKSSAIALGDKPNKWIGAFYTLSICFLCIAGLFSNAGWPLWIAISICAVHFLWQTWSLLPNNSNNCLLRFRSNAWVGAIIFFGILCSNIWN